MSRAEFNSNPEQPSVQGLFTMLPFIKAEEVAFSHRTITSAFKKAYIWPWRPGQCASPHFVFSSFFFFSFSSFYFSFLLFTFSQGFLICSLIRQVSLLYPSHGLLFFVDSLFLSHFIVTLLVSFSVTLPFLFECRNRLEFKGSVRQLVQKVFSSPFFYDVLLFLVGWRN